MIDLAIAFRLFNRNAQRWIGRETDTVIEGLDFLIALSVGETVNVEY